MPIGAGTLAYTEANVGAGSPATVAHTPNAAVTRWAAVFISSITATDNVTAVTYGGVAMSRVVRAVDTASEPGSAEVWFLGAGVPDGAQNAVVTFGGSTEKRIVVCTASADSSTCQVADFDSAENDQANPSLTLDSGADTGFRIGMAYSGQTSPASVTPAGTMTNVTSGQFGTGSKCFRVDYQTTPSSGSASLSWTMLSDDFAGVGIVIIEAGAGNAVSGEVTQLYSGAGVDGVTLQLTGTGGSAGTDYTAVTSGGGAWTKTVASGWSGTISLASGQSNRVLTPSSRSVSNVTAGQADVDFQVITSHYVATTGNDSNAGTAASPILTIAEAIARVDDGEFAEFAAGSYQPGAAAWGSGDSGQPGALRTFKGAAGATVTFTENSTATDCLVLSSCHYVRFQNIDVDLARDGINANNCDYLQLDDVHFTRCEGYAIQAEGTSPGSRFWMITNSSAKHCNGGFRAGQKNTHNAADFTVTDCEFSYNCGRAALGRWDGVSASAAGQTPAHRNHLLALLRIDDNTLYAAGIGGKISKTTNGGTNWSSMTTPSEHSVAALWGPAADDVWAVGMRGLLWHWDGAAWGAATPINRQHLLAVHGSASGNIWACGKGGTILKWNGSAWSAVSSGTTIELRGIHVADANTIYVVGAGGAIRRTTNGGSSWAAVTSGTANKLYAITKNTAYFWAVGESGTILRSADGASWSARTAPDATRSFRCIAANDSIVWVGGYSDDAPTLVSSDDNGDTAFDDRASLVVHTNLGWANNDVNLNALAIVDSTAVLVAGGVYNESSDGVALTHSEGDWTFTRVIGIGNGDDFVDTYNVSTGSVTFVECEAYDSDFSNELDADGNGYKCGVGQVVSGVVTFQRCRAAGCSRRGFDCILPIDVYLDNCTAFGNGEQGCFGGTRVRNLIAWSNGTDVTLNQSGGTYSYILYSTGSITGGSNLITSDPLFVDEDAYDFRLDTGSPAIDAGVDVGLSYSGGGPDLGALESDGTPTVPGDDTAPQQTALAVRSAAIGRRGGRAAGRRP